MVREHLCVPNDPEIRKLIFQEAHDSPYSIHPGNTKMYMDLRDRFWRSNMKREIAEYIALCDVCSRVKDEHQKSAGLLQPLLYLTGSGTRLVWISSQDCPRLDQDTILFG
jgi:hypothetical protein